jgi:HxlR-like helix-turn-helix
MSKAAEVVLPRWTPLILRELLVGSTHFNEIRRGVPTCSPALLSKRLTEVEGAGVAFRGRISLFPTPRRIAETTRLEPESLGGPILGINLGNQSGHQMQDLVRKEGYGANWTWPLN